MFWNPMPFSVIEPACVASSTVSSPPKVKVAPVPAEVIAPTEMRASFVVPPSAVEITGSLFSRKFVNLNAAMGRFALFPKCWSMPLFLSKADVPEKAQVEKEPSSAGLR